VQQEGEHFVFIIVPSAGLGALHQHAGGSAGS
jgi:hypothetical protein